MQPDARLVLAFHEIAARELADAEDKLAAMKKARDEFEQQVAEAAVEAVETKED